MKPFRPIWRAALCMIVVFSSHSLGASAGNGASAEQYQREISEAYQRMSAVRNEHKRLGYFEGDWDATTTLWMAPDAPPVTSQGILHAQMILGGRYLHSQYKGVFMNQPIEVRGLIGFDNANERYFATWIDSNTTGLWTGVGNYDENANALDFAGTINDPMRAGQKIPVRETMKITDATHYTFTWFRKSAGKEVRMMQVDYIRRKANPQS